MSKRRYRSLVTRSDQAVTLNELVKYLNNSGSTMCTMTKFVLTYLQKTNHCIIRYKSCATKERSHTRGIFIDSSQPFHSFISYNISVSVRMGISNTQKRCALYPLGVPINNVNVPPFFLPLSVCYQRNHSMNICII